MQNSDPLMDEALARYELVKKVLEAQSRFPTAKELYIYGASLPFVKSDGSLRQISASTVRRYVELYQDGGFEALIPRTRNDKGLSRKVDDDLKEKIAWYLRNFPNITSTRILEKLIEEGVLTRNQISVSTIRTHVRKLKAEMRTAELSGNDFHRYELEACNMVWYGDTAHGPYISDNGKPRKVYIIALIDDASRLITGCSAFFKDDSVSLYSVMESAVMEYGVPDVFDFDNGPNYKSQQVHLLAARLNSHIHHTPPYTPTAKSKIERFFNTLRSQFLCALNPDSLKSLGAFRQDLSSYIQKYNTTVHSSLDGLTPYQRFFRDPVSIRKPDLDENPFMFYYSAKRKAEADGIIHIENKLYELPSKYAGSEVSVFYQSGLKHVYIEDPQERKIEIFEVDKVKNGITPRFRVNL